MLYLSGLGRYIPNPEFIGLYTWNFALTTIGCSRFWCYHLLQRRVKVFGICLLLFHIFTCLLYTYNGFKFWALGTMFCNQYLVLCTCMGICASFMLTMHCQLYFLDVFSYWLCLVLRSHLLWWFSAVACQMGKQFVETLFWEALLHYDVLIIIQNLRNSS